MSSSNRDPVALADAVLAGDRTKLPRLLSVVEQGGSRAREAGRRIYASGTGAYTVGITGPPGAGKSTLTDRLIGLVRAAGDEVAVLAVDPTSPYSGGALLGDRVRMMDHALDAGVFVRSLATRGHLGGLALAVPELGRVFDAAGFPWVIVETVGVGQSEVEIAGTADTTVVVLNPGAGDGVQANKAGLLEVADVFVINKADLPGAGDLERDLSSMMDMTTFPDAWRPPIVRAVAAEGKDVAAVWDAVSQHRQHLERTGSLDARRGKRALAELRRHVMALVEGRLRDALGDERWVEVLGAVRDRAVDPWTAAEEIVAGLDG